MPLDFPNPSRSYNQARHSIRFSGYDGAFEVLFSVDANLLPADGDNAEPRGESDYLSAFDHFRETILDAARKAYARGRKDIYQLDKINYHQR